MSVVLEALGEGRAAATHTTALDPATETDTLAEHREAEAPAGEMTADDAERVPPVADTRTSSSTSTSGSPT
jgi:hypothetical protein